MNEYIFFSSEIKKKYKYEAKNNQVYKLNKKHNFFYNVLCDNIVT